MPKKKYNNYDNTLFGRYIRQIENPDSIGWDSSSRIWRQSTRKGDDERNRGMGIDVLNNKAAKKLTQDRVGGFLTEEEERQLRNEYLQEMLNVIDRQKAKHPGLNNMSPRKQAEVIGALYRGDAPKLWDKSTILGKALGSPNEEDFHRAIDTYYNSVGLGERARNNDKFWSNQTRSNQSPHVPSPTITRQIDGMVFPTMSSSQPTITKQDVVDAAMLGPKAVAAGVGTVANYINQAVQKYVKPKDNSKDNTVRWAEGGFLKPKDAWDALSMKDKADMIGIAVKHGITTLSDIRDKYNEFAEGGDTEEPWTMQDEANYRQWRNSLPENLRDTNDDDYDMRGAFKAGMQPILESDGKYHLQSRDPKTGRILKAPHHPTFLQAIATDASMGYYPRTDNKGQTYTQTWRGNEYSFGGPLMEDVMNEYRDGGGIHIKPSHRGRLTELKKRTGKTEAELYRTGSPATRKMITFARSARKWKHGDGGDLFIGGELPEVIVTGYAPLRLTTYYPVTSKYPYTGHSKLDIPIDRQTWYNYTGEEPSSDRISPYMTIDKKSSAKDYNLVINNCADATLSFLNNAFGTSEKPWLFTTPGDVRDYALKELNGKLIKNNDGSDTVLIPRNAKTVGKLSTTALNMFDKDLRGIAGISYKGPFNYAKQYRKRKHGLGGNLFDGTSQPTQKMKIGKPYYSYDGNGRKIDDTLNYNISLPEVVIIPDSKKSPTERNENERYRQRTQRDYAEQKSRDYTEKQIAKSQKEWENSLEKAVFDYGQAAATGIGIGADIVSGLPIYSSLKGASTLSRAETPIDYVEGGLWLAPVLGGTYQTVKPAVRQTLNLFKTDSPFSDWVGITQHNISDTTKPSGLQETQQAAERGRNKLLDWINSSFYKQRIEEEPFYRFSNDIVDEASSLVENAPLGFDKTVKEIHPSGQITGETVTRPALKIRDDGYRVFDLNTGLDVNIGSDLGNEAEDVTLHELLHYLTVNSKGIPKSTDTMQIVDKGWMQPLEALFNPVGKNILRGKKWQSYILDQNDALLPKYDAVVDMVMHRPEEAKAALLKAGRTEAEADVAIKSLRDRYEYWSDIQEQRAYLQELFISKIKPHLKNPNDAAEIEAFLTQHPDILESSSPYNFIQEVRPGSLKQYSKYFASALGTLPFIMTNNNE